MLPRKMYSEKTKGGKRKGSGRPFKEDERRMYIRLNALQKRILLDLTGENVWQRAVQKYLDMHL